MPSRVMSPFLFSGAPTKLSERDEVPWELFNYVGQGDETMIFSRKNNAGLGDAWQDRREVLFPSGQEQQGREMAQHERLPPPLLSPVLRGQLIEWWRNDNYEQLDAIVSKLASDARAIIAPTLVSVLLDQTFDTPCPPRGSFGNREPAQFAPATQLIRKEEMADRQKGLELLKDLKVSRASSAHPLLVEKWCLFAEARVHGLGQAFPDWKAMWERGEASEEEVWNLAVFYARLSNFKQALEVLRSGIDAPGRDLKQVSLVHLRFALYCAAQILVQHTEVDGAAIDFLCKYLNKWPEPACFLAWILLEKQGGQVGKADHQIEQIKIWRTLYNLLDQPIPIPELDKQPEVRVFVNQLRQIGFHETLLFWLNDYRRISGGKVEKYDNEIQRVLGEVYEDMGEINQAGEVWYTLASEQLKTFQRQRDRNGNVPGKAFPYMREALMDLFTFYKRHGLLQREDVFQKFERFYKNAPELWDDKERRNKELIALTQTLLERVTPHNSAPPLSPRGKPADEKRPLHVEVSTPDQRLSYSNGETVLPLRVSNSGPGKVEDIQMSVKGVQSEQKTLVSKQDGRLDALGQDETRVVVIPVVLNHLAGREWLECRVDLVYQWDGKRRATSHRLSVGLFHFRPLPNPYDEKDLLDTPLQEGLLLAGRQQEVTLFQERFLRQQGKGGCLYFYGMPKIGKTSLLNHLALILKEESESYVSCVVHLNDLKNIQPTQQNLGKLVALLTQCILRDAQMYGLQVQNVASVQAHEQNLIQKAWFFFQTLFNQNGFQSQRRLVLLLDDFDFLVAPDTRELLDLLAMLHQDEQILFVLSGRKHPDILKQNCPRTRLFPWTECALDLFPCTTIKQMLQKPLIDNGVMVLESTTERLFQRTAGHPWLVTLIASALIERLNGEQRMVVTPQDIDEIVGQLAPPDGTPLVFLPFSLTVEEQRTVRFFAHETKEMNGDIALHKAIQMFEREMMFSLWGKYLLEYLQDNRGEKILRLHQQIRMSLLGKQADGKVEKRVSLFVDYENIFPLVPKMGVKEVGNALITHASRFGEAVCCWAVADPRNLKSVPNFKFDFEQAGFRVRFPRDEPREGKVPKNGADFAFIDQVYHEKDTVKPDIYIIASGDRDYYETICRLIEDGATVRLCASSKGRHLAEKYCILEQKRRELRRAKGLESDFFIDDLDRILSFNPQQVLGAVATPDKPHH